MQYWQPVDAQTVTALGLIPLEKMSELAGGYVLVEYVISSSGAVENVQILQSEPDDVWTRKIVKSMLDFHYEPTPSNTERQPVRVRQRLELNLRTDM